MKGERPSTSKAGQSQQSRPGLSQPTSKPSTTNSKPTEASQPSVGGGLFNSIASFFLTETELAGGAPASTNQSENPQTNPSSHQATTGEETEYEYYDEEDEDEGYQEGFMKENLDD